MVCFTKQTEGIRSQVALLTCSARDPASPCSPFVLAGAARTQTCIRLRLSNPDVIPSSWCHSTFQKIKPHKGAKFFGRGGIRTLGRVAPTSVFKTDALNHSATLPIHIFYEFFAVYAQLPGCCSTYTSINPLSSCTEKVFPVASLLKVRPARCQLKRAF